MQAGRARVWTEQVTVPDKAGDANEAGIGEPIIAISRAVSTSEGSSGEQMVFQGSVGGRVLRWRGLRFRMVGTSLQGTTHLVPVGSRAGVLLERSHAIHGFGLAQE